VQDGKVWFDILDMDLFGFDPNALYRVEDLFIPESHAVPRGGPDRPQVSGRLYVFTPSTLYSSGFAGVALGIARAMLDDFIADVRATVPRGAKERRGDNNVIQAEVGRAEARIRSARALLLNTVAELWRDAQEINSFDQPRLLSLRLATTWAIQQARETVAALYLAAGAMVVFERRPFEKRFRDIHTLTQQIQGHAAHFETVGQILMGDEPSPTDLFAVDFREPIDRLRQKVWRLMGPVPPAVHLWIVQAKIGAQIDDPAAALHQAGNHVHRGLMGKRRKGKVCLRGYLVCADFF